MEDRQKTRMILLAMSGLLLIGGAGYWAFGSKQSSMELQSLISSSPLKDLFGAKEGTVRRKKRKRVANADKLQLKGKGKELLAKKFRERRLQKQLENKNGNAPDSLPMLELASKDGVELTKELDLAKVKGKGKAILEAKRRAKLLAANPDAATKLASSPGAVVQGQSAEPSAESGSAPAKPESSLPAHPLFERKTLAVTKLDAAVPVAQENVGRFDPFATPSVAVAAKPSPVPGLSDDDDDDLRVPPPPPQDLLTANKKNPTQALKDLVNKKGGDSRSKDMKGKQAVAKKMNGKKGGLIPPPPPNVPSFLDFGNLADSSDKKKNSGKTAMKPSSAGGGGGLALDELPLPPSRQGISEKLKVIAIIGDKVVLQFTDKNLTYRHKWPTLISLGPGEQFESVNVVSVEGDSVTLEEDGERQVKTMAPIR